MSDIDLLRKHPFAVGLTEEQLALLAACSRLVQFVEGQIVFREDGEADAVYLLLSGRVVLEQHVPGKGDIQLESLTSGDMLGLSWLFPASRWVLAARVIERAQMLVLDAKCVHARMEADAGLGLVIAKHVIQQLYQRLERVRLQRLDVYGEKP